MNSINHRTFQSSPDLYTNLIGIYTRGQDLHSAKLLHAHLITNGLARLAHFASKLVSLYAACGQVTHARYLFDEMPHTNTRRWVALIGGYSRCGLHHQAMEIFCEMQRAQGSRKPDRIVIPSVLKACGHLSHVKTGEKLHTVVLRHSFDFDVFVTTALIDMYSKNGCVEKARKVYDMMAEKDLVALNAVVSGLCQHGSAEEALVLVERMQLVGVEPNLITWNTLVAGFSQKGDGPMVSRLFNLMRVNGMKPDVVSWTSVISGFVKNFQNSKAFHTFKQMLSHGIYPTSDTLSSLLPACVTNLRCGKEVHAYALVMGVEADVYVRSALVDMYAKCGFISEAKTLFCKMSQRNTATWNSMIFGYANHGYCTQAIELLNKMKLEDQQKLDYLTFVAVLTACCHAGMIEIGKSLFNLMQEEHGIMPRLEHYACMVDLLGRAGQLTEAYDMIKAMPMEPDLFVWGAILGASRKYGNIELAEIAANQLSELEPENAGNNLLLSRLYADAGNWVNVARLMKIMKKKKLRKLPGCSWTEAT